MLGPLDRLEAKVRRRVGLRRVAGMRIARDRVDLVIEKTKSCSRLGQKGCIRSTQCARGKFYVLMKRALNSSTR